MDNISSSVAKTLLRVGVKTSEESAGDGSAIRNLKTQGATLDYGFRTAQQATSGKEEAPQPIAKTGKFDHVGRNDICPCGSGKKFKKCHGVESA